MKIGELADRTDVAVETIRFYEREGLLPEAPRSEGNYRVYGAEHVERLTFIRQGRALDMTLDEVRTLLQLRDAKGADCGDVDALLDAHIGHVAARIRELRQLDKQLRALRARCEGPHQVAECGILSGLAQPPQAPARRRRSGHVAGTHDAAPRRPRA